MRGAAESGCGGGTAATVSNGVAAVVSNGGVAEAN